MQRQSKARYLADPGELQEKRWEELKWRLPADQLEPCWWLVTLVKLKLRHDPTRMITAADKLIK